MAAPKSRSPSASTLQAYERIWRAVAGIPPGKVATYGQVADMAGLRRRARLVGQALSRAPRSLELPWHRVINARGSISFSPDSEPYQRQKERLEAEGVVFHRGRVDLFRYGFRPSLDALLWGPGGE